jgi:hypothetical protein
MNAQDDESLDGAPPPPPPAPTFDRNKARGLLNTATRYGRNPGGDFVALMAEQLRLALAEIDGSQGRINQAQSEQLRAIREAETANAECVLLRRELLALKTKPAEIAVPKKRGPRAKVVPMAPDQQKAAQ